VFAYLLTSGLTLGALYALAAIGLVIVIKATSVVNLAQGELFMIGGFFGYTFHVQLGLPYLVAFALAVIASGALGAFLYALAFRPLMKVGLVPILLVSVGVAFVLKGLARFIWGGVAETVAFPPLLSPEPVRLLDVALYPQQLVVVAAVTLLVAGLSLLFRYTDTGRRMRAIADNVKAATLVGLPVEGLRQAAFGLSAGAAGAAAVLMAPITQLYPDIGFGLFVKAFAAAVLGGLTSLPGAVVGGLAVGMIEAFVAGYIASKYQDVAPFLVIMLVLLFFPRGLLGGSEARRA
jgi:branched-chain amino acid transport system permease protein